jgi:ABC-type sugar transport system substrate-binding protein
VQQTSSSPIEFVFTRSISTGIPKLPSNAQPAMQGYLWIVALYRHVVLRESVKKQIMVPLDVLTRDNFTYYQD